MGKGNDDPLLRAQEQARERSLFNMTPFMPPQPEPAAAAAAAPRLEERDETEVHQGPPALPPTTCKLCGAPVIRCRMSASGKYLNLDVRPVVVAVYQDGARPGHPDDLRGLTGKQLLELYGGVIDQPKGIYVRHWCEAQRRAAQLAEYRRLRREGVRHGHQH